MFKIATTTHAALKAAKCQRNDRAKSRQETGFPRRRAGQSGDHPGADGVQFRRGRSDAVATKFPGVFSFAIFLQKFSQRAFGVMQPRFHRAEGRLR